MDELVLMSDMTNPQRVAFQSEMNTLRKNPTTALMLCLFLGGIGAHRFYLGQVGLGLLYVLFCITLVPAIVSLIELFLIKDRVRQYDGSKAVEVARKVKILITN